MIYITTPRINGRIVTNLKHGAEKYLTDSEYEYKNINIPGCFELLSVLTLLLNSNKKIDAIIVLGCIIHIETKHDVFLHDFLTSGLSNIIIKYDTIITNGIIVANNIKQALVRSEDNEKNYGHIAAKAAIEMLEIKKIL